LVRLLVWGDAVQVHVWVIDGDAESESLSDTDKGVRVRDGDGERDRVAGLGVWGDWVQVLRVSE